MSKGPTKQEINRLKERLRVMEAYLDGKQIQVLSKYSIWININQPCWALTSIYRIKPELKYRPFKTFDEAKHLLNNTVQRKNNSSVHQVVAIGSCVVYLDGIVGSVDFQLLFDEFQTYNGNVLGVLDENQN